jgi:hypothetical protein
MAELGLAVLVPVAEMETVGLIALEIGDGRNFKPTALSS